MEVLCDKARVFIDGEYVTEFSMENANGRYVALIVDEGTGMYADVCYSDFVTGEELFSENFGTNIFERRPEMSLSEIERVSQWIPAEIPGSVQSSLMNAGLMEDPYYGYNGPKCYWVELQRWVYKTTLTVPDTCRGDKLRLVFGGVAYHGYFYLNGKRLCYHEGTLAGPELDITDMVIYGGENELVVCVLPSPHPYHNNVEPWILHRWHFNMDVTTLGIWQDVKLIADTGFSVYNPKFSTRSLIGNYAACDLEMEIQSDASDCTCELKCLLVSPDGRKYQQSIVVPSDERKARCSFDVTDPLLWWPNTLGAQPLYEVQVEAVLRSADGEIMDHSELSFKAGIRKLEMIDAPNEGTFKNNYRWVFCVNGKPFFAKGSNWMPIDQLLRLTPERYDLLLRRAKEGNLNMLRPWGAGLVETDEFYEKCDEYGILVWQEFPMADGWYQNTNIEAWKETVRTNVLRIRNHPSLAMLCGGNECHFDDPRNVGVVDEMKKICEELMPEIEFHRGCPHGGDTHSYDVNWGGHKYYSYFTRENAVAVTEFSMASPPSYDTIKKIVPEEELSLFPPDIADDIYKYDYYRWGRADVKRVDGAFARHDAHLWSITNVMLPAMSDCGIPKNWEEFISYMQTAHGMLTQFGQDYWRSRWPNCTCSMSWVFNVVDPDTMCWSYIDYYGVPKRSYFYKKRSFESLHVGAFFDDCFTRPGSKFEANVFVHNETGTPLSNAQLSVRLYDIDLNVLKHDVRECDVCADGVSHFDAFSYDIPTDASKQVLFLLVDLMDSQGVLRSRSFYCPRVGEPADETPYLYEGPWISDVRNAKTDLEASFRYVTDDTQTRCGELILRVTGDKPAYQVSIEVPDNEEYMTYEDNFFWMEPGETRHISIRMDKEIENIVVSAWNSGKQVVKVVKA